jgi:hypothetical protein
VIDCNEWKTVKRHECTDVGKVKRLELWWQLYVTSLPEQDVRNIGPLDFLLNRVYHMKAHYAIIVQMPVTVFGSLASLHLSVWHCWFERVMNSMNFNILASTKHIFIYMWSVWVLWVWLQACIECCVLYMTFVLLNNMGIVSYILEFWYVFCTNSRMWWWTPIHPVNFVSFLYINLHSYK